MGLKWIQLRWWVVLILILVPLLLVGCNRPAPEPEGAEVAESTTEEGTTEEQTMPAGEEATTEEQSMPTEEEGTAATEETTAEETTAEETTAEETTAEEPEAEETTEEPAAEETTAEETTTEETAPPAEQSYVVLPGDTLFSIGQTYGVSVEAIAARNGIINVHQIKVGQTIIIPAASVESAEPEPPSSVERTHLVQVGENLFRISLAYNMSFETVAAYNNIPWPYHVQAGQEIKIPPAQ
jgi:LysM repeat protein